MESDLEVGPPTNYILEWDVTRAYLSERKKQGGSPLQLSTLWVVQNGFRPSKRLVSKQACLGHPLWALASVCCTSSSTKECWAESQLIRAKREIGGVGEQTVPKRQASRTWWPCKFKNCWLHYRGGKNSKRQRATCPDRDGQPGIEGIKLHFPKCMQH